MHSEKALLETNESHSDVRQVDTGKQEKAKRSCCCKKKEEKLGTITIPLEDEPIMNDKTFVKEATVSKGLATFTLEMLGGEKVPHEIPLPTASCKHGNGVSRAVVWTDQTHRMYEDDEMTFY